MRKRPLLWFACVFLSGLTFQRYQNPWFLCIVVVFIGLEIYFGFKHKQLLKMAGRSFVLLSAFLLGMTHMRAEEEFRKVYMSQLEEGNEVTIWGEVIKIEETDYGVRMILSDSYISLKEENTPCNDIMVYASSGHFHVGEIHKITGQFHSFAEARNEGNFDSCTFYQSQRIDFSVWMECNVLLGTKESKITSFLFRLKDNMAEVFCNCMTEKVAGFYSAMVLGDKTNLDEGLKALFTLGGISHILAISGLHVSIIGRGCYIQLRKRYIGYFGAGLIAGGLLLGYCYMVGSSMSTVRAVGMMLIFFLGQYLGRSYDMLNALGAICLVLLWDNPFLLEYSGFWFSVMALIGIGVAGKTKGLGICVGITLATLPVTACCNYEIPLYSPLVNSVALPILTPIFCLALFGGIIGIWIPWLAKIFLLPCEWTLFFYEWLCMTVEKLPCASIICGKPKAWVVVVYYAILSGSIVLLQRRQAVREDTDKDVGRMVGTNTGDFLRKERALTFVVGIICLILIIYPKEKSCEITFLDVGQGDAIYISAGDGTTYFIDGGSTSEDCVGEYRILPFLKAKGISSIDYWFVSHADTDHISGLLEVLEDDYKIDYVVLSKYIPKDENYDKLLSVVKTSKVEIIHMDERDQIVSPNARVTCLYPWEDRMTDRNDTSLVLELEINTYKALFAGDISSEIEALLLKRQCVSDIWLYKVSHHGSKYSNSEGFLEVLRPEVSVISCAENNFYGHPHEETINLLKNINSDIYYTMKNGQVTFLLLQ